MYALLLVLTPFILLRNYMVQAVSVFSASSFDLFGLEVKIVPMSALLAVVILLLVFRKHVTRLRLLAVAIVVFLDALAQQVTDYYFGHNFYDLQQNWHYIAYGLYAYMIYRDLSRRNLPLHKIMLATYFSALGLSIFDEFFQMFMSSRVFDICDTGKDLLGVLMGMVIVYFSSRYSTQLTKDWKKIRQNKLKGYYRHPSTLLFLLFVLTFIFLVIGSLLTESEYAPLVGLLTIAAFALFVLALHVSQHKAGRAALLGLLVAVVAIQGFFFVKYRRENIVHTSYGLTVYKGIAIPFFDVMIFQDGTLRLVDKKHYFNQRDREFFLKKAPDILLIGGGSEGKGGKGFDDSKRLFLYNHFFDKATQVIIQKNQDACETFNRLKSENKKVIFVIHNTC